MGLARPGSALLSRSAGLARARHHRRHPDSARTKEKAAHRLRARLKRAAGVAAAARRIVSPALLFQGIHAGHAGLQILRPRAAAAADRPDQLAAGDQRHPALRRDHAIEGQLIEEDRKSTRLNSSHMSISYAVFCLKK